MKIEVTDAMAYAALKAWRLARTVDAYAHIDMRIAIEAALAAIPERDGEWSEHDRIEFALRDAGFDYDRAYQIAASAPPPPGTAKVYEASPDAAVAMGGVKSVVPGRLHSLDFGDELDHLTTGEAYNAGWNECCDVVDQRIYDLSTPKMGWK